MKDMNNILAGALNGNADAQYNLGIMYASGLGVIQAYNEAVKWFRLSSSQGNAQAQEIYGLMYASGRGVTQDYVRAHMWLNISASSGDKNAEANLDIVAKKCHQHRLKKHKRWLRAASHQTSRTVIDCMVVVEMFC